MKILLIAQDFPYPPVSGDKIRNFNLIKMLSKRHVIHLLSFVGAGHRQQYVDEMEKYCACVKTVAQKERNRLSRLFALVRTILSGQPQHNCFWAFEKAMGREISSIVKKGRFDIIQIEHSYLAAYIKNVPKEHTAKKVLTLHNISFVQYERMFRFETRPRLKIRFLHSWLRSRKWEPEISGRFDKCITMSETDRQALSSVNPALDIDVVPNGVDLSYYQAISAGPGRNALLFVGLLDYIPNADAVLYFCREIFPLISRQRPDVKFFIIGRNPPPAVLDLRRNSNVDVAGHVGDLRSYYERSSVSVVPLRSGGGTRLKILEAMAMGMPVVSTFIGCEGLDVISGENILIADEPEEFAGHVLKLLSDENERQRIGANARSLVENCYSWEKIANDLDRVYGGMLAGQRF